MLLSDVTKIVSACSDFYFHTAFPHNLRIFLMGVSKNKIYQQILQPYQRF